MKHDAMHWIRTNERSNKQIIHTCVFYCMFPSTWMNLQFYNLQKILIVRLHQYAYLTAYNSKLPLFYHHHLCSKHIHNGSSRKEVDLLTFLRVLCSSKPFSEEVNSLSYLHGHCLQWVIKHWHQTAKASLQFTLDKIYVRFCAYGHSSILLFMSCHKHKTYQKVSSVLL